MSKIYKMDTIHDYNSFIGQETLHPHVSVVDFSQIKQIPHVKKNFGFYSIFLKGGDCGALEYGRGSYDYQDGTMLFVGPGQVLGDGDGELFQPKGCALLFHPDLIRGTLLSTHMKDYTFFSYDVTEALHLSEREKRTIHDCLNKIKEEIERPIDYHSRNIIVSNINLLLDYCLRFYDRQFITRTDINKDIVKKFDILLDKYMVPKQLREKGIPNVAYFASELCLSSNYFGDLIKKETGRSPKEYIQFKLIELAKERVLSETDKSIAEIAYELGFQYPHYFSRLFKRVAGCSPVEYKSINIR